MPHQNTQRVVLALLAAALPAAQPAAAQAAAGAGLWRLPAATLATPPALAVGAAAAMWNPAQPLPSGAVTAGLELIETSAAVRVTGFVSAVHVSVRSFGALGLSYGRMDMSDLVRTLASPEPVGGPIPYHAAVLGASWTRTWGRTTVGTALRRIDTQLDADRQRRWTVDGGVQHRRGRLRLGAATHFLTRAQSSAAQDVDAGVALDLWEGEAWVGSRASRIALRYGVSFAHGAAADHLVGIGITLGDVVGIDALATREGGYNGAGWRPVAGLTLSVGRYRVTLAGNASVHGVGSAYRVGIETEWR
jgi:hypothetical protein